MKSQPQSTAQRPSALDSAGTGDSTTISLGVNLLPDTARLGVTFGYLDIIVLPSLLPMAVK